VSTIPDFEYAPKNVSNQAIKHECYYCGGYTIVHANHHLHMPFNATDDETAILGTSQIYTAFHIEDDIGNSRKICPRCLIKMFDKIIPKQKKQKKVHRKRFLRPKK
jgi:hypothetical protein